MVRRRPWLLVVVAAVAVSTATGGCGGEKPITVGATGGRQGQGSGGTRGTGGDVGVGSGGRGGAAGAGSTGGSTGSTGGANGTGGVGGTAGTGGAGGAAGAGGAGAAGGAGGVPGAGGAGGAEAVCAAIAAEHVKALRQARRCTTRTDGLSCQMLVDETLGCGCNVHVEDAAPVLAVAAAWKAAGCTVTCTTCQPTTSSSLCVTAGDGAPLTCTR